MQSVDGTGAGHGAGLIKDSDSANFVADVLEASREVPVIVDFWAPWCGPCKQLGPALEKVVREAGGAVRMVKVNVDENQSLAGQMGVQSIPAVFAFRDGIPVDGFMGALPESQIREFVEKIGGAAPAPEKDALEEAREAREKGDLSAAMQSFAKVLELDSQNIEALAGMAEIYLEMNELEQARNILELVPESKRDDPLIKPLLSRIALEEKGGEAGEIGELSARLEKDPDDHQTRFDLALALNKAGDREDAIDHLVEIVRRKSDWSEGAARKQLLEFFEAWGANDPMTIEGRRRLSSVLFA
jgi:putative thioredoxin